MKRAIFIIISMLSALSAKAELIDRMMATVNGRTVTLSDVRLERELRRILGEPVPADDKAIVKDLVERLIIEEQIAQFPGIDVADEQVEQEMSQLKDLRNVPRETVREAIRRRFRASEFFNIRFRQFLQASDEEVQQYYESKFVPEAKRRGLPSVPPVADVTTEIRNNLIQEKLMHEVDTWLAATRRRSDIEIFD